jgi:mannose-6-phosphate isomerase-like protein (cupin superfamily)
MTANGKHQSYVSAPGEGESFSAMGEEWIIRTRFEGWTAFEIAFGRDVNVPPHSHPWAEVYSILTGGLRMMIDGVEYDAPAGTLISIPADVVHQPRGPAAPNTRVLDLMGPGCDPQLFRDLARVTADGTVDPQQVLPILKRYGVQPLAPAG